MQYRTNIHNPSGGIKIAYEGDYLDGMLFHAAQESYYNRDCPVYVYKSGVDAQSHVDGETTWAFFNGQNITMRNKEINERNA